MRKEILRQIILGSKYVAPPGQEVITATGTGTWLVPDGVTSVCVVCVGPGGRGGNGNARPPW